jgi:hypothetical protein
MGRHHHNAKLFQHFKTTGDNVSGFFSQGKSSYYISNTLSCDVYGSESIDFNCEIVRKFAENLPQIMVVREDLSRVILNLLNNVMDD